MSGPTKVHRFEDAAGSLVFDERYYPVLVATWQGSATAGAIEHYFLHNDRNLRIAIASGQHFAMINDAAKAARPDAQARALIAKYTQRMKDELGAADALRAANFVVVTNALVRGALTAIGWIVGGMDHEYASSVEDALERSRALLAARGVSWPEDLSPSGYALPPEDGVAAKSSAQ